MLLKELASDSSKKFVIAMDGPAASGKGSLSKALALYYNLDYCSSSVFYRKLASLILKLGNKEESFVIETSSDIEKINNYNPNDLYTIEVSNFTSVIAAISEVRANMHFLQRNLINNTRRIIMEGRDIGSVIAPDADFKIFITATPEIRAKRRYEELKSSGVSCRYEDILADLKIRDERDSSRAVSPLIRTVDAFLIDNSDLDIDSTLNFIKNYVEYH